MISLLNCLCRSWNCARRGPAGREAASKDRVNNPTDDLTAIRGIGITTENRLYASGIKTYADLAEASLAELREILGGRVSEAKIEDWMADAAKLAGKAGN